jgi:hypothetical protein
MARKKRVVKRRAKRAVSGKANFKNIITGNLKQDVNLIVKNLLLFIALSLVSLVFNRFLQIDLLKSLFFVMAVVFGAVAVAFLMYLLVLWIMELVSKKK